MVACFHPPPQSVPKLTINNFKRFKTKGQNRLREVKEWTRSINEIPEDGKQQRGTWKETSEKSDNEESFIYFIKSGTGSRVGRKGISAGLEILFLK